MGGKEIIMGWLKNLFEQSEEQKQLVEEQKANGTFGNQNGLPTRTGGLGTVVSYLGKELIANNIDNSLGGIILNTASGSRTPSIDENENGEKEITPPNQTIGNKVANGIQGLLNQGIENIKKGSNNLVDQIKEKIENAFNKTPSDSTINEYKDDTNKMILEFLQQQEQTRQKELKDAYAREDEIRKETQEREDSAYQRAVEDMRKAGINPNLVGISPSASGGGISSASRSEQILGSEIQSYTTILNALIEKDTTMTEGDKNRLSQLISAASNLFLFSKLGG